MAKIVTLDDIIANVHPEIVDILSKDFREVLDKRTTILDLSYDALKVNVYRDTAAHIDAYNTAYRALVSALDRISKRKFNDLKDVPPNYLTGNFPFIYINGGDNNRFIVGSSFGAIDEVVRKISRDPEVSKTSFGTSTIFKSKKDGKGRVLPDEYVKEYRRKTDIGHIPTEGNENLTSPLEEKIAAIMQFGSKVDPRIEQLAKNALDSLYSIQASSSYSFKNTSPEAIRTSKNKLGEGYVVVTLHRQKLNNKFSQQENKIFFNLKNAIAKLLSEQPFDNLSGSNTVIQDIAEAIKHYLDPKKHKFPKGHTGRKKTTPRSNIKASNTVKSTAVSVKRKFVKPEELPQSAVSLQDLINSSLHDQIRKNMGTGNSRGVLNYRTGRFARSAKVERISQSRQGMITAFYSYMKNPYATFSQGGLQQYPRSRDPKTLISRSIREIAQNVVSNQLRAVNV